MGELPLLAIDTSAAQNIKHAEVTALTKGTPPGEFTFPEQSLVISGTAGEIAALDGDFALSFNGRATALIPVNVSGAAMTTALMELETVGEVEVFRTDTATSRTWLLRFYAEGDPAHIGAQPPIEVNASTVTTSGSRRRRLSVGLSSSVVSSGSTPSTFTTGNLSTTEDDLSNSTGEAVTVTPVVHVCGNGIRSTSEGCDDNNTLGGDGCDALCIVETGYSCVSNTEADGGSGVGGLDTCAPKCGDGIKLVWAELCDDNNTFVGDGCNATCNVEPGFACSGGSISSKDTCSSVCGDGLRVGFEACDDGNLVAGDGCDDACNIEVGYTCSGGSATATDTCTACHASCATCSGTGYGDCDACAAAYPFFNALGSCTADSPVETCMSCLSDCTPVAKYANASSVCVDCDSSCGTCSGQGAGAQTPCSYPSPFHKRATR